MAENRLSTDNNAAREIDTITLNLYATLARYQPRDKEAYAISKGMTVRDLLNRLGVPLNTFKLIFINGHRGELDSILCAGDRVGIFPPIGGG